MLNKTKHSCRHVQILDLTLLRIIWTQFKVLLWKMYRGLHVLALNVNIQNLGCDSIAIHCRNHIIIITKLRDFRIRISSNLNLETYLARSQMQFYYRFWFSACVVSDLATLNIDRGMGINFYCSSFLQSMPVSQLSYWMNDKINCILQ